VQRTPGASLDDHLPKAPGLGRRRHGPAGSAESHGATSDCGGRPAALRR